jgi:hypothetical protein
MSQRVSGYERKERDSYETPAWVTEVIVKYINGNHCVWEPAAGSGKMVEALRRHGMEVIGTDITSGHDFLSAPGLCNSDVTAILTNPPYVLAREFIERALRLTEPVRGVVAMLLRTDFDHAHTRRHLFGDCRQFWAKVVLTKRIKWFQDSKGQPSFNHAWFLWSWAHDGVPMLAYGPDDHWTVI